MGMFMVAGAVYPGCTTFFPPQLDALLAWSRLFRCKGTFDNYVSYVKTGCMLVKTDLKVSSVCGWHSQSIYIA